MAHDPFTNDAFSLWDSAGRRLYLDADERASFREVARDQGDRELRTYAHLLLYTGARPSEGLAVTSERFAWRDKAISLPTLKKRGDKAHSRVIPLPPEFLDDLDLLHRLKDREGRDAKERLWNWHRATAWRKIKGIMDAAGIEGPQATAKGLRHSFGVIHAMHRTPLPVLQRFMGHSDPKTTAIYMQVVGKEAQQLAAAAW